MKKIEITPHYFFTLAVMLIILFGESLYFEKARTEPVIWSIPITFCIAWFITFILFPFKKSPSKKDNTIYNLMYYPTITIGSILIYYIIYN